MMNFPEFVRDSLNDPRQSVVGRVRDFLTLEHEGRLNPASCTMFLLAGNSDRDIEELVKFVSPALRGAAGINVHLDKFNPLGVNSSAGSLQLYLDSDHPDYSDIITSEISGFVMKPGTCVMKTSRLLIPVDSMDDVTDEYGYTHEGLDSTIASVFRYASASEAVVVDLSLLRPNGTTNQAGLTASGAVSFGRLMVAAYNLAVNYSVENMLSFLSSFNEELRKGGIYKRGALVATMPTDHTAILDFLQVDPSLHQRLFKAIRVTPEHEQNYSDDVAGTELERLILDRYNDGDLWLSKSIFEDLEYGDQSDEERLLRINVCVTADTLVSTSDGIQPVLDLIGKEFIAVVNGKEYPSSHPKIVVDGVEQHFDTSKRGFWSTGINPVYRLETTDGRVVRATANHKFITADGNAVELQDLEEGDRLAISLGNHVGDRTASDYALGWLAGQVYGNGTRSNRHQWRLSVYEDLRYHTEGNYESYLETVDTMLTSAGVKARVEDSVVEPNRIRHFFFASDHLDLWLGSSKEITGLLLVASVDARAGFLSGYFDADCHANYKHGQLSAKGLELSSVKHEDLAKVQMMLGDFGIKAGVYSGMKAGVRLLPGSDRTQLKECNCQAAKSLRISTLSGLQTFSNAIGLNSAYKSRKLQAMLDSYSKAAYVKDYVTVKSVEFDGYEETYNCTISTVHQFSTMCLITPQCHEVYLKSRQTCDLSSVNLAACQIEDVAPTTDRLMRTMIWLHSQDFKAQSGIYESAATDKQIGLGFLGLASFLAANNITYAEFAKALSAMANALYFGGYDIYGLGALSYVKGINPKAVETVIAIFEGLQLASQRARAYGLKRAFAIAPTASVSFRSPSLIGDAATPEISPPLARKVERTSQIDDDLAKVYDYGNVEIASEVDFEDYQAIVEGFQLLFNYFGLGQSISFNYWREMTSDSLAEFMSSEIRTVYYRLKIDNGFQDKTVARTETVGNQTAEADNSYDFLAAFSNAVSSADISGDEPATGICKVGDSDCSSCAS